MHGALNLDGSGRFPVAVIIITFMLFFQAVASFVAGGFLIDVQTMEARRA